MKHARVVQLSVSPGGVPKLPIPRARVTTLGLEGDAHRDEAHHGGPDRAVCLFSLEQIEALGADVLLEVTRYTSPCVNIRTVFKGGEFSRVSQKRNPGWSRVYARVLEEGVVRAGDAVELVPPPR